MAFGKEKRNVRTYAYGTRPPITNLEAAIDSMRKRVTLWNSLVELEKQHREKKEAILAIHIHSEDPEEQKVERRAAFKLEEVKAQLELLETETYQGAKPLCRSAGCYTWQEDDLISCWRVARKKLDAPRFQPFRPYEGVVALRWQNGLPVEVAQAGTDTRLQIVEWEDRWNYSDRAIMADPNSNRSKNRIWKLCRFRVASDEKRQPIWLEIPVCFGRPLPEGTIRKAWLRWWRVGSEVRWQISFVVEEARIEALNLSNDASKKIAAIDICWRKVEKGIRIAYLGSLTSTGLHEEEFIITNSIIKEFDRVDRIRSFRDNEFNKVKEMLNEGVQAILNEETPEWFLVETRFISKWRSPARLARLMNLWRDQRFPGDEGLFARAEQWRKHDRHHWQFEANLRDQLLEWRKDTYRKWANKIAKEFSVILLENFDLRNVTRVKKDEEGIAGKGKDLPKAARHQRFLVAPSEFRLAIMNACGREGVLVEHVDSQHTTMRCASCGEIETEEEFDKRKELVHQCAKCGHTDDQDLRACLNMLKAYFEEEKKKAA